MSPKPNGARKPAARFRTIASPEIQAPSAQDKPAAELKALASETTRLNALITVELLKDRNGMGNAGERVNMRRGQAEKYQNSGIVRIVGET